MRIDGINIESPEPGRAIPARATPLTEGVRLDSWLGAHLETVHECLLRHGAILFRGLDITSPSEFSRVGLALGSDLGSYDYRSTPRTELADNIYTATEYPRRAAIPLHNEESYSADWPRYLMFSCLRPGDSGGATPLAMTSNVTRRIPEHIYSRFAERGVLYVRNLRPEPKLGFDEPWPVVFQSDNRSEVEARCRALGIQWEWESNDVLRIRHRRHSLAEHPQTGEMLWFNQAHLFHMSSMAAPVRKSLLRMVSEDGLPRNAYCGDGSPIDAMDIRAITHAYEQEKLTFAWQSGDVLLLDNMLVCHGREPFDGPRNVLVAMTGSFARTSARTIPAIDPRATAGSSLTFG